MGATIYDPGVVAVFHGPPTAFVLWLGLGMVYFSVIWFELCLRGLLLSVGRPLASKEQLFIPCPPK